MSLERIVIVRCDREACSAQITTTRVTAAIKSAHAAGWRFGKDRTLAYCPLHRRATKVPRERQDDAEVIEAYAQEGATYESVGVMFGVSRERIRQRLVRNGVTRKPKEPKPKPQRPPKSDPRKELEALCESLQYVPTTTELQRVWRKLEGRLRRESMASPAEALREIAQNTGLPRRWSAYHKRGGAVTTP